MPYDNNLTGSLFRNERKRDDKDPSHQGSCEIDGKFYYLSAWVNEAGPQSKTPGQKFFSIRFKAKDAPAQQPAPAPAPSRAPAPAQKAEPAKAAAQTDADGFGDDSVPF